MDDNPSEKLQQQELKFIRSQRIQEAKAIIGLAQSKAADPKNITLHKMLPPLTNKECRQVSKEMFVKYKHIRKLSPRMKK